MQRDGANPIDVTRALALICVIYGHSLMALWFQPSFADAAVAQWRIGAAFVMQALFFLSGLCWRETRSLSATARQGALMILLALAISILVDLIIWAIGAAGLAEAMRLPQASLGQMWRHWVDMAEFADSYSAAPIWFLTALAIARMIAALAIRMRPLFGLLTVLAFAVAAILVREYGERNYFHIPAAGIGLIFFMGGHYAKRFYNKFSSSLTLAVAALVAGVGVLLAVVGRNTGCLLAGCETKSGLYGAFIVDMSLGETGHPLWFAIASCAGIAALLGAGVVLSRLAPARRLARLGRNSLGLYVVHAALFTFATPIIFKIGALVPNDHPLWFFACLFVASLGFYILAWKLLRHPMSFPRRIAYFSARRLVVDLPQAANATVRRMSARVSRALSAL